MKKKKKAYEAYLSNTDMTYRNCSAAPTAKATPQKKCLTQKHKTLTTAR